VVASHLRKAVIQRDKKCRFPGCQQPPSVCQIHHLIPWAKGGPTTLGNLALFCRLCRRRHNRQNAELPFMPT
jgi:5-methylcytosine-specific restriction protein A